MSPGKEKESIAFRTTLSASRDRSVFTRDRPDAPPAFAEGDVVAERYRIVRFLERGGMGEVYEAEDTLLAMRVAIKCIAAELAADERMIARIKQEVLLARKVTHPNVCRLYDLGFHNAPHGTVAFLTMDLLRGETLAAHLARKTRLTVDEARPLVHQMASALEAAHRAGVIHRDFKTRNVMLEGGGEGEAPRVVVMDFGIACAAEEAPGEAPEASEARWVGTPAYMAPEQVRGDPVTIATDVFSFGVVLYEMMTGRLPFEAKAALTAITMRLTEAPPVPRALVPSLDRAWSDAILRCLAVEPRDRFASARDVETALHIEAPKGRGRWVAAAGGAIAIAALATGIVIREKAGAQPTPAVETAATAQAHTRPTVAVLALRDIGARSDTAWLGSALGEMIATELSAGEQLRVVGSERVATVTRELGLSEGKGGDSKGEDASIPRLRAALATDYVVTGAYVVAPPGPSLRVDLTVHDARSGALLAKVAASGSEADLFGVVASAGEQLRRKLGVRDLSASQQGAVRAAVPLSADAVRAYAEGLVKLRAYDFRGARDRLEQAVAADPGYVLAHSALARAWRALGYDARAIDEAKKAFEASHDLSREDQLAVEARYRAAARDYDRAIDIYRTLSGFFPDNVDYGLEYANTLQRAGKAKEGLTILDALHRLPAPLGNDPRIDFQEAVAASKISDTARRIAAARAAIAKADPPRSSLSADARTHLGEGLEVLGDAKGAAEAFEAARVDYAALGDRAGEASALGNLAGLASSRGDATKGVLLAEQALAITRETGDQYRTAGMLNTIGIAKYGLGASGDARALWEEARAIYESIGNREGVGHTLGNIGVALEDEGDLAQAKSHYAESLVILRSIGNRAGIFDEEGNLGELALQEGELGEALAHETTAFEEAKAIGGKGMLGRMKAQQAARLRHEGDAAGATRAIDEALALRKEADEASSEDEVMAARLALDDGRASDAEVQARHAAEVLHEQHASAGEASALATLAISLAALGKSEEATTTAARATSLAASLPKMTARFDAALGTAAAQIAAGHGGEAATTLRAAAEAARKYGFVACDLELRLALARSMQAGARSAALARVAADAKSRGFLRVVRLAK